MIIACGEIIPRSRIQLVNRLKQLKDAQSGLEEQLKQKDNENPDVEEVEKQIREEEQWVVEEEKKVESELQMLNNTRQDNSKKMLSSLDDLIKSLNSRIESI